MLVYLCPWFGLQAAVRAYLSDYAERQGNTEASFKVRYLIPFTHLCRPGILRTFCIGADNVSSPRT